MSQPERPTTLRIKNSFVRVVGVDAPLPDVIAVARTRGLPVTFTDPNVAAEHDYVMVDGTLDVAPEANLHAGDVPAPPPGLGYAGFTPLQRAAFLAWLAETTAPAPLAFRQLYLANLEVRLLGDRADAVRDELLRLHAAPAWHADRRLAAAIWLALWLAQDGDVLAAWLCQPGIAADMLGIALGSQALLDTPLLRDQLRSLVEAWHPGSPTPTDAILALRLNSLTAMLGMEPLVYALANLDEQARTPTLWRGTHRGLRLWLPQPDLRPVLDPLLRDMLSVVDTRDGQDVPAEPEPEAPAANIDHLATAHVILEFGHSRSEFFAWALRQAQKQRGFSQIMDENRQLVYRVPFRRSEMRRFWQLWDAVQGWSSARVYCDGRELDKWQVYPYSQYLR